MTIESATIGTVTRRLRTTKTRIMVVEDNEGDVILLKNILRGLDYDIVYTVHETVSGALADLQQTKNSYDLVILDTTLPDSSGLETVHTVLSSTNTPVIAYTASNDPETAYWAGRLGAAGFVCKSSLSTTEGTSALSCSIGRAIGEYESKEQKQDAINRLIERITNECSLKQNSTTCSTKHPPS